MKATDTKIYFAKATFPVGNNWRSPWTTQHEAEQYAKWFCQTWATCMVKAKSAVFYRDGSLVHEYANDCPTQGQVDDYKYELKHSVTKD